MANNNDNSSIFWSGIVVGGLLYLFTDSFGLSAIVAVAIMFISWLLKGVSKKVQQEASEQVKEYAFDFDALNPTHKSHLLKQQFDYFLKYRATANDELEFYCAKDELDGYRFAFWIEYLIDSSSSSRVVRVRKGDAICNVYIYSNKGRAYGCEKFTITAPNEGIVTGFLKGSLQKDLVLFRIKRDKVIEITREEKQAAQTQEKPLEQTANFYDILEEEIPIIVGEEVEVEKLEDVLRWEMPDVDDIEMPEEGESPAYDSSVAYHATITNLSDFDWYGFKAVCYSSTDNLQKEVKPIGNVKIGTKTLLSSQFDMFFLEGKNSQGEQKRFRSFALEKDSDITVTTIFEERT